MQSGNNINQAVNPGRIQFDLTNNRIGQTSNLITEFTSYYVGGKTFSVAPNAAIRLRFRTTPSYRDKLSDGYIIKTTYVRHALRSST